MVSTEYIEQLIRQQFPKKKDAQENAAAFLIEEFRRSSDMIVKECSEKFCEDVEAYLGQVERCGIDSKMRSFVVGVPFNVRGVFQGVLAGIAGTGALAVWSSLAFGSSFGFYVLTAKIVSVISAFGISISGGTAAVIGTISVIGAPLVIGAGLAMIGGLIGLFLGKSWQKRLAENICKEFQKRRVLGVYRESVASFWKETATAFEESCNRLEEARGAQIENYRGLLFDRDRGRDGVEEAMARVEEWRDFFVAVPWSRSKQL